eukprot:TRINITY_DN15196_c0_g1_i2.p1 TRINITY_DN15196_c0_g1~~TRINITY_DN15196_c0_g1_i2.p1  ORF type:complete len:123 (+),score=27.41 TRINITY_DN15196_c0_g1_i2:142-510(+)
MCIRDRYITNAVIRRILVIVLGFPSTRSSVHLVDFLIDLHNTIPDSFEIRIQYHSLHLFHLGQLVHCGAHHRCHRLIELLVHPGHLLLDVLLGCLDALHYNCLLYTSPSPRDRTRSRMPSSA